MYLCTSRSIQKIDSTLFIVYTSEDFFMQLLFNISLTLFSSTQQAVTFLRHVSSPTRFGVDHRVICLNFLHFRLLTQILIHGLMICPRQGYLGS